MSVDNNLVLEVVCILFTFTDLFFLEYLKQMVFLKTPFVLNIAPLLSNFK